MIEVGWQDEEQRIVRIDFAPPWTREDYALAQLQLRELIEGIAARLDLINFIHPDKGPPPAGLTGLVEQSVRQMPRQFVMIITVNGGQIAEMTHEQLDRMLTLGNTPFKLRTAETVAQACAMIAHDRKTAGTGA